MQKPEAAGPADVLVIVSRAIATDLGDPLKGVRFIPYDDAEAAAGALEKDGRTAVISSDGLPVGKLEMVARAVRDRQGHTIEVRSTRWDGQTTSPLSAACRGVILGFGAAGVLAAIGLLRD